MFWPGKKIVILDKGKITLPQEFLPEGVCHFVCERSEDGRIILSPIDGQDEPTMDLHPHDISKRKAGGTAPVIDLRSSPAFKRKQHRSEGRARPPLPSNKVRGGSEAFVTLQLFPSRMEAEMLGEILKQSGLPYLIQSEDIGVFGPGAGPAPGGARLVVRSSDLEEARGLLLGLIELP